LAAGHPSRRRCRRRRPSAQSIGVTRPANVGSEKATVLTSKSTE
jgi:hypothetical protein